MSALADASPEADAILARVAASGQSPASGVQQPIQELSETVSGGEGPGAAATAMVSATPQRPDAMAHPDNDSPRHLLVGLRDAPLGEVMLGARLDLADTLSGAIAAGQLGPRAYLRWISAERALCAAGAAVLHGIATRVDDAREPLREAAATLAAQAAMAAADLRRTDGMVAASGLVAVDHWCDYHDLHAASRPGRVLGLVALHAGVAGGPARAAISAVLELPFLSLRGATCLVHRQLQAVAQCDVFAGLWPCLPGADMQRDVLAGATHAAGLYREIVRAALAIPSAATPGWRWPDRARGSAA